MGLLQNIQNFLNVLRHRKPIPITPPAPPAPPGTSVAAQVVSLLNVERANRGLEPLTLDARLNQLSQSWANTMATNQSLTHGDFPTRIASVYPNTAASEDIGEGYARAQAVVDGWMGSPAHKANILGPYNLVGVGMATAMDGSDYWCSDFDAIMIQGG